MSSSKDLKDITLFWKKLVKENKLAIISSNNNLSEAYFKKSKNSLRSAKILLDHGQIEDGIALAYYSDYHALTALLLKIGIKCENHLASIQILNYLLELNNKIIKNAKQERIEKQYFINNKIAFLDLKKAIEETELFLDQIQGYSKNLTQRKKLTIITKLKIMIN